MKNILIVIFLFSNILFASSIESKEPQSAVVFMYHHFGESKYPSTNITIKQFQYQLDYLETNNYNIWPLSKIVNHIIDKKTIPQKTVAITIDDAYLSIFTQAYPMLKSKNFPFTVFVSTNSIYKRSNSFISWEQMRIMKANGAQFANHSSTHTSLLPQKNETKIEWKKRIIEDIKMAQLKLQKELGSDTNINPPLFSYPFGEYNMQIAELIKKLGYIGITQTSGPIGINSDLRVLTRFPMAEAFATIEGFITKLNTIPMPIESISKKEHIIKDENPPKLRIKLSKALKNMGCYLSNGEAIKIKWISQTELEIRANFQIKLPREKYTCTAPAKDGKWYWYSHLWIIKK